jgi:hypothetical protein
MKGTSVGEKLPLIKVYEAIEETKLNGSALLELADVTIEMTKVEPEVPDDV